MAQDQAKPTVIEQAMTPAQVSELVARLAAAEARVQTLQTAKQGPLTVKRSEKGAVSVYGLGRFPVTLYGSQWERLLGEAERIKSFLITHKAELATKQ